MKLKLIVFLAVLMCGTAAVQASPESVCSHVDLPWLEAQVSLPDDAKIVFKQGQGDLCEVVVAINGQLAPLYAGKDFIVAGQMYRQQEPVTRQTLAGLMDIAEQEEALAEKKEAMAVEHRQAFFKTNSTALAPLVAMTFGPGSAKDYVYVVTDPNCAHCKAFLPQMEEIAFEAHITLKLVIYPVLGEISRDMAAHALCNEFNWAQYDKMTGRETLTVCDRSTTLLSKTKALFSAADIFFVPLVVAGDGSWVVEGGMINDVRRHLGLPCDENEDGSSKDCRKDPEK